tara:strand:+ start:433 stop:669 length:237 start_codon:yes stop_codon:yes gene_type:complete
MQVILKFDTETENVQNLTKLVEALQKLIAHRTGNPIQSSTEVKETPKKVQSKTGGGCRVIPYEDMSERMSCLLSGRRY